MYTSRKIGFKSTETPPRDYNEVEWASGCHLEIDCGVPVTTWAGVTVDISGKELYSAFFKLKHDSGLPEDTTWTAVRDSFKHSPRYASAQSSPLVSFLN